MKKYSIIIVYLFLIYACETTVTFQQASPPDVAVINAIPDAFIGMYRCQSDSTLIVIDEQAVYSEQLIGFTTTKFRVNETEGCNIKDGGVYFRGIEECVPFKDLGDDRIYVELIDRDTLFAFREGECAKFYKGHLFINHLTQDNSWVTFLLTPQDHHQLLFEYLEIPNNPKAIEAVTLDYRPIAKPDEEEDFFMINPSLIEFEEFLQDKFRVECEVLDLLNFEY